MTYLIIAIASLLHVAITAQDLLTDEPITLCMVIFSQPDYSVRDNHIPTLLASTISTDSTKFEEIDKTDCQTPAIKRLIEKLQENKLAYIVKEYVAPRTVNSNTLLTDHICFPANNNYQCIDYQLNLHQSVQYELGISAMFYNTTNGDKSITNLHKLKHSRRLHHKQHHYIDDQDVGIFISHNIK